MGEIAKREFQAEQQYLRRVLHVLRYEQDKLEQMLQKQAGNLQEYRRLLWENRQDFKNLFEIAEYEDRLKEDVRAYQSYVDNQLIMEKAINSPYFARIDFREDGREESEAIYIGLTSVIDRQDFKFLVLDWRAPISGMYYDFDLGEAYYYAPSGKISGNIVLKRQFSIKKGKLILAVDTGIRINDMLLLDALQQSKNVQMQQIVYTIQQEQNSIIRSQERYLWIQGVAGSGKTSVLLHRIAYLLYRYKSHLIADNFVILSPNSVFSEYIASVLPSLGEKNARQMTFYDLARHNIPYEYSIQDYAEIFLPEAEAGFAASQYKSSPEFFKVLEKYRQYLERKKWQFKDVYYARRKLFEREKLEEIFNNQYADIPLNKRYEYVENRLIFYISTSYKKFNEKRLRENIRQAAPDISAIELYFQLFTEPEIWHEAELGEMPDNFREIAEYSAAQFASARLDYCDLAPILYLKHNLEAPLQNYNIRHVLIDEVQIYSLLQLKLLHEIFHDAQFTFSGDIWQRIRPLVEWQLSDIDFLGLPAMPVFFMNRSYRITAEIGAVAQAILPQAELQLVDRHGDLPTLSVVKTEQEMARVVEQILVDLSTTEWRSVGIITDDVKMASLMKQKIQTESQLINANSKALAEGVNILPADLIGGLEFDSIIYLHSDNPGKDNRQLAYTIFTRALHRLHIVSLIDDELFESLLEQGLMEEYHVST